ncbi:MAG: hypothetical protein AAF732_20955 [Pseudomonadota bacterium]
MTRTPLFLTVVTASIVGAVTPAAANDAGVVARGVAKGCVKHQACRRGASRVGKWLRRKGDALAGSLEDFAGAIDAGLDAVNQDWSQRRRRRNKLKRLEILHKLSLPKTRR